MKQTEEEKMALEDSDKNTNNNEIIDVEGQQLPPPEEVGGDMPPAQKKRIDFSDSDSDEAGAVKNTFSVVAASPTYKKLLFVGLMAVLGMVAYLIIYGFEPTDQEKKDQLKAEILEKKEEIVKTAVSTPVLEAPIQSSPVVNTEPPPLAEPTPPEPPPPPVPVAPATPVLSQGSTIVSPPVPGSVAQPAPNLQDKISNEQRQKLEAKRKSSIIVKGGGGKTGSSGATMQDGSESSGTDQKNQAGDKESSAPKKPNYSFLGFGNGALESTSMANTEAEQVRATKIGNLDLIIAEGKMMNAVLETAIDTDLTGMLRAQISHDVYAESGKNILVPKGTRIIGTYDSEIKDGQTRVAVIWNRLIRPDGIDIKLDSPGTDALGRAGVYGKLDTKFWTRLGAAALVSFVVPIMAKSVSGAKGKDSISTTTTTGAATSGGTAGSSTTTNSNLAAEQAKEAADKFSKVAEEAIKAALPVKPTINIDQGTKVNIFVKKDLIFPIPYSSNAIAVQ